MGVSSCKRDDGPFFGEKTFVVSMLIYALSTFLFLDMPNAVVGCLLALDDKS